MFWFRLGIVFSITADLLWAIGLVTGILLMISSGTGNMTLDPTLNNTMTSYVFILIFQFGLIGLCFFGYFTCIKVWMNKYMLDAKLRHLFVIWEASWIICLLGTLATAIYALIRGKDPQGQMGFMYEMFQKYAIDPKFVSTFERYQKDHSCCGLYGPDDWLIVQLRAMPGGGGGGMGMFQSGSMDYGFQQNPSTGKCHIVQPLIPPGCGPMIMKVVNAKLSMYAGLSIFQVFLGFLAAFLAWYCFFYWLEKEVIVIPEDEVSNIVVIEPEDSYASLDRRPTAYASQPVHYGSNYIHHKKTGLYMSMGGSGSLNHSQDSMKFGPASTLHRNGNESFQHHAHHEHKGHMHGSTLDPLHHHHVHDTALEPFHHEDHAHGNSLVHSHQGHPEAASYLPLPAAMMNSSLRHFVPTSVNPIPLHHNSFLHTSLSAHEHHHHHHHEPTPAEHEAAVDKQLKTLGGKVLAKMHVDQKLDENGQELPKEGHKKKATLAIVKNKHLKDPDPPPPPGNHGQTGNLAQDIAALGGGKKVLNKIEDLVITDHPEKKLAKVAVADGPEILGSVSGFGAGSALNNLLEHGAATETKRKELEKKAETPPPLVKPVVVGTTTRLHGGAGSVIQEIAKHQQQELEKHLAHHGGTGSEAGPHGNMTMGYLPLHAHHTAHAHQNEYLHGGVALEAVADHQYHAQPPATLDSLVVPNTSIGHGHSHLQESSFGFGLGSLGLGGGNSAYGGHSSLAGHSNNHRASIYDHNHTHSLIPPDHNHRASIFESRIQNHPPSPIEPHDHHQHQHHPTIYITPAHDHHHNHASVTSSRAQTPPNGHRPSLYIKPKHKHSRLSRVIEHHQKSRSRAASRNSSLAPPPHHNHHHQHYAHGSRETLAYDQPHHTSRESLRGWGPGHRETMHHHLHHDNSGTGGRRGRSIDAGPYLRNEHRTRQFPDDDYRRRSGESRRYSNRERERSHYGSHNETRRSRSPPHRLLYDDDDDEYDYQPPPDRRDRHGSRSSYNRRRDEENARVIYKNPRRLEDSD